MHKNQLSIESFREGKATEESISFEPLLNPLLTERTYKTCGLSWTLRYRLE